MRSGETRAYSTIRKFAGRAIKQFGMIEEGDRILVGISGGVDSMMLMHVLNDLRRRAPISFDVMGATVEMGFKQFNPAPLQQYCLDQGWEYRLIIFPGDAILVEKNAGERPCSLCSRLRRGQLYKLADELKCNKIALGQHLDDMCVSFLMSLFRGNGLKTMGPNVAADDGTKRIIRPLCLLEKSKINLAARSFNLPDSGVCDYAAQLEKHGDRAFLEQLIGRLDGHFANIRACMLTSMGRVETAHLLDPVLLKLAIHSNQSED